jgi:hypothetical protein
VYLGMARLPIDNDEHEEKGYIVLYDGQLDRVVVYDEYNLVRPGNVYPSLECCTLTFSLPRHCRLQTDPTKEEVDAQHVHIQIQSFQKQESLR